MAEGRKTGGRKRGTPNKITADLRALAGKHGKEAVDEIMVLARTAMNENTRLAAWKEILDRGFGKATQSMEMGGPDGGPIPVADVSTKEAARLILAALREAQETQE